MACAFEKLPPGRNLLICSALIVMGQLIVSLVVREVIIAFNIVFKNLITWPSGNKMEMVMQSSIKFSVVPQASMAIDGTHFSISKTDGVLWENYFYQEK
jgi:hypothetical protein